jgi:PAP2 superfamily
MRTRLITGIAASMLLAMAVAVAGLSTPARGQPAGNMAIDWNALASTASMAPQPQGAGQPPHAAVLSLAMVQGAVYDAVNAIDGGHQPYLVAPPVDPGASKEAAAATAAFCVLAGASVADPTVPCELPGLFPGQFSALKPVYDASLASVPGGPAKDGGIAAGEAAAQAMLTARTNDGRFGPFTFPEGFDPGEWRLAPPQGPTGIVAKDPAPWVGFVKPFLVPNVEMLRTDGPNALTSAAYTDDFNEVKELGSLTSTKRTADETAAAIFWQDSGPAIWNRVYRSLAGRGLDIADSARLFATTNLAAADGSIGCWNDKAYWSFWRPITAIREATSDGNPATEADPNWLPLFDPSVPVSGAPLVTPGFPDHPAGHTCVSGATVHALQAFFGTDKVSFTATSNKCSPAPCPTRSFDRFSDALKEIIDARVWGGIHFRTADVQGAVLGRKVARYLREHYFQPVDPPAAARTDPTRQRAAALRKCKRKFPGKAKAKKRKKCIKKAKKLPV